MHGKKIRGKNFQLSSPSIRSPTYHIQLYYIILSCLDEPSSSGDVNHGVEPSHPVERETGNQVAAETKLEPGALELYQPEVKCQNQPLMTCISLFRNQVWSFSILRPWACMRKLPDDIILCILNFNQGRVNAKYYTAM